MRLVVGVLALFVLVGLMPGCAPHNDYDVAAVCTTTDRITHQVMRVEDNRCSPDGGDAFGSPYRWFYSNHYDDGAFDYPYVGSPVPRYYAAGRPRGINARRIDRGFPSHTTIINNYGGSPAMGRAPRNSGTSSDSSSTTSSSSATPRTSSSTVTRGGFGAPSAGSSYKPPAPRTVGGSSARSSGGSFSGSKSGRK